MAPESLKVGTPKGVHDTFTVYAGIKHCAGRVTLPIIGEVKTKEHREIEGCITSATVSREADRWFGSLAVEQEREVPAKPTGESVGIDLGLKTFAVLSTGERIQAPKPLKRKMKKLQRLSRQLSRKKKGSRNRAKSQIRVARLHRSIRNTRKDFLHKTSTRIAKNHGIVCIEDLAIRNMMKNRCLARAISDAGWGEFGRMLGYKTQWYGSELRLIDRFAPSSKTCSECGAVNRALRLSDRVWVCQDCGCVHERDDNASSNILNFGTVGHRPKPEPIHGFNACGDSSVGSPAAGLRYGSVKQEGNSTACGFATSIRLRLHLWWSSDVHRFSGTDCISWVYSTGFPKSLNAEKALLKHLSSLKKEEKHKDLSEFADQWRGHGTALKPAWEPILVIRKPMQSTLAINLLKWGCGSLNIDNTRIPVDPKKDISQLRIMKRGRRTKNKNGQVWGYNPSGSS